jgi:hypothetical protein
MQGYAQCSLSDIDLAHVEHKSIKKYVARQLEEGKQQFDDIQPSWNTGDDLSAFSKNEMTFFLDAGLQEVWHSYLAIDPSELWNHRRTSKGLMLQKFPMKIFYNTDSTSCTDIGQVYFLNLKLMSGMYNVPAVFEIISIDAVEKVIAFSYVEGNRSSGVQQLKFEAEEDGATKIVHTSYFKSDSRFRDKWLYPYFHKKLTRDFHKNVKRLFFLEESALADIVE